jgi:hypothetical protein
LAVTNTGFWAKHIAENNRNNNDSFFMIFVF